MESAGALPEILHGRTREARALLRVRLALTRAGHALSTAGLEDVGLPDVELTLYRRLAEAIDLVDEELRAHGCDIGSAERRYARSDPQPIVPDAR